MEFGVGECGCCGSVGVGVGRVRGQRWSGVGVREWSVRKGTRRLGEKGGRCLKTQRRAEKGEVRGEFGIDGIDGGEEGFGVWCVSSLCIDVY